jgi:hypothetical protein
MNKEYNSRIENNQMAYSMNLRRLALVQPGNDEATHNPQDIMNGGHI